MNALEEMAAVVDHALENVPEEDRKLAADIAKDIAKLAAKGLQGEDVSRELPHVRAQATLITASVRVRLEHGIMDGIARVARRIVQGALVG